MNEALLANNVKASVRASPEEGEQERERERLGKWDGENGSGKGNTKFSNWQAHTTWGKRISLTVFRLLT